MIFGSILLQPYVRQQLKNIWVELIISRTTGVVNVIHVFVDGNKARESPDNFHRPLKNYRTSIITSSHAVFPKICRIRARRRRCSSKLTPLRRPITINTIRTPSPRPPIIRRSIQFPPPRTPPHLL